MAEWSLVKTRIVEGVWQGVLSGGLSAGEAPELVVTHLDREIEGAFLISKQATGERLASFTVVTGEPLEDDIRGELDLLRAELDMLKKAFRRHCLETM